MSSATTTVSPPRLPVLLLGAWALCTVALLPLFIAAQWAGNEVAKYQHSTFEGAARQALAARDFASAIKYCDGAIKASHERSDHWGRVYTLRSVAYLGANNVERAASELLLAGDFFTRRYYFAEEQDRVEVPQLARALGQRLLADGNAALALEVFSAGAMASGRPVEALHTLTREFDPATRQKLWGDGAPYIRVASFLNSKDNALRTVVNEQGRAISDSIVEPSGGLGAAGAARASLGASQADGNCWLAVPTHVQLTRIPFAVRVHAKLEKAADLRVQLGYWFESPQKSAASQDGPSATDAEGWTTFDIKRDFLAERSAAAAEQGYAPEDGMINQIALLVPPGEANTVWLSRAEIYLPQS